MNDKDITITITANPKQFQSAMKAVLGATKSASKALVSGLDKLKQKTKDLQPAFRKMAAVGTAVFAGVSAGIGKAVKVAADSQMISRMFDETFGRSTNTMRNFAKSFSKQFGFVQDDIENGMAGIAFQLGAFDDISEKTKNAMNKNLVKAAAGLSRSMPKTVGGVDNAIAGLSNALAGNTQQLVNWGFNVREADIKNEAYKSGIAKQGKELTQSQKAQALYNIVLKQTKTSQSTLEKTQNDYLANLGKMKNNMNEVTKSIGQAFLPTLNGILKSVIPLIDKFANWTSENKELARIIGVAALGLSGLSAGFGTLGMALPKIITGVQLVGKGFKGAGKAAVASVKGVVSFSKAAGKVGWKAVQGGARAFSVVGKAALSGAKSVGKFALAVGKASIKMAVAAVKATAVAVARGAVAAATGIWTAAQWLLNAALNANPLGLILMALVAVGAALALLWNKSETFRNIVTGVFNAVWGAIKAVWNWVKKNWPMLLAILTGPIGIAVALIIKHWDTIKKAFKAAIAYVKKIWGGIADWFGGLWKGITNAFKSVKNWFGNMFRGAVNTVKSAFNALPNFFRNVWTKIRNTVTSLAGKIGSAAGNAVRGAINGAISTVQNVVNGFIGTINGAIGLINKIPKVNIPRIPRVSLPRMATGGIVDAVSGGRDITVAEGGQSEWIVPESKMASVVKQLAGMARDRAGAGSQQASGITIESGGSFITVQVDNHGQSEFSDDDAIDIGKKIARALKAQGLNINQLATLRN